MYYVTAKTPKQNLILWQVLVLRVFNSSHETSLGRQLTGPNFVQQDNNSKYTDNDKEPYSATRKVSTARNGRSPAGKRQLRQPKTTEELRHVWSELSKAVHVCTWELVLFWMSWTLTQNSRFFSLHVSLYEGNDKWKLLEALFSKASKL